MTLEIEFTREMEERLRAAAVAAGEDAGTFVRQLVERQLVLQELEALPRAPTPSSLEDLKPRVAPPEGSNGLSEIIGKWPGDESDDEILRALDEMS